VLRDLARPAGLSVPPTLDTGLDDVARGLPFPYPVVVKAPRSELECSDGVFRHFPTRRADSAAELRAALAALPGARGLVQPFLRGPLGSLAGVFWDGEMVCAVQSRGDRVWPPPCGSMTYTETVPPNHSLVASIGSLLRTIGWNGVYQVDFFEQSGEILLLDLNPRFYTSLASATGAGMNLPGIWVDLLRGRAPRSRETYRTAIRYRHDEDDVRVLLGMLLRGRWGAALRGLVPRRNTVHPVFSLRDPWPVLSSLSKLVRQMRRRRSHGPVPVAQIRREARAGN
jgi:predicted ATP-grasp superfamily ATP-dependent carboligase